MEKTYYPTATISPPERFLDGDARVSTRKAAITCQGCKHEKECAYASEFGASAYVQTGTHPPLGGSPACVADIVDVYPAYVTRCFDDTRKPGPGE